MGGGQKENCLGVGGSGGSGEGRHKLPAERNGQEIKRLGAPEMLRLNRVQGLCHSDGSHLTWIV